MFGFRIASARRRVSKANAAFSAAYAEYNEADNRQDTRRISAARTALQAARREQLTAENALEALEAPAHGQVAR